MGSAWLSLFERRSKGNSVVPRPSPRRRLLRLELLESRLLLASGDPLLDPPDHSAPSELSLPVPVPNDIALTLPVTDNVADISQVTLPDGASRLPDIDHLTFGNSSPYPATGVVLLYRTTVPDPDSSYPIEINLWWDSSPVAPNGARLWLFDSSGHVLDTTTATGNIVWILHSGNLQPGQNLYIGVSGFHLPDSNDSPSPNRFFLSTLHFDESLLVMGRFPLPQSTGPPATDDPGFSVSVTDLNFDRSSLAVEVNPGGAASPPPASGAIPVGQSSGTLVPSIHALPTASLPPMAGKLAHGNRVPPASSGEAVNVDFNFVAIPANSAPPAPMNVTGIPATILGAQTLIPGALANPSHRSALLPLMSNAVVQVRPGLGAPVRALPGFGPVPDDARGVLTEPRERTGLAVLPPLLAVAENEPIPIEVPVSVSETGGGDPEKVDAGSGKAVRFASHGMGTIAALSVSANLLLGAFCPDLMAVRQRQRDDRSRTRSETR